MACRSGELQFGQMPFNCFVNDIHFMHVCTSENMKKIYRIRYLEPADAEATSNFLACEGYFACGTIYSPFIGIRRVEELTLGIGNK